MGNQSIRNLTTPLLAAGLILAVLISARYGAVQISWTEIISAFQKYFGHPGATTLNERIFLDIRLPRALLCVFVGACLAVGGTLMQALFRNPIVEPGWVGTSSGAAFGAALYFVLGSLFHFTTGEWTLPLAATAGAFIATLLVFVLARSRDSGRSSIVLLLLTGIAMNALFMSGVGFLSYIARDPQARSITFWGMGTLSGANWHSVWIVGIVTLSGLLISINMARPLNALMMGEDEALYLGVHLRRLKWKVLGINVLMIAVATSFVGVISFVGLIVPHLLRMLDGADNRRLIRNSALAGGIFLSLADIVARLIVRPAELPIGIVTSLVGVPVFIYLLRLKNYYF